MRTKFGTLLRSTETRVVFALLALLALVDLGLRLTDGRLSGNVAHVEAIPQLIADAGRPERQSMLLLGNSLTNNGVAPQVVTRELPSIALAKVTPDATGLWSWQCLLDHQVIERPDVQFDTVVIGFAWNLLSDQTRSNASRLGGMYCDWSDLGRAGEIGLRDSADIGEFIAAKLLRTYALRETLRNRLFQFTVPHYVEFTQANNTNPAGAPANPAGEATQQQYTYRTFTGLVNRLKAKGTRVIVVAMPVQKEYQVDPQLRELADRGVVEIIDLREAEGIKAAHYLDGIHLNSAGQRILSRVLAEDLAAELRSPT
jgi:hypothetical protein